MNLLTFDVEDWYHTNFPRTDFSLFDRQEDHQALALRLKDLTDLCRAKGVKATFFILGRLLEKRPDLGERIVEEGHELALHGYEHDLLTEMNADRFQRELERSLVAFRRITGGFPEGFRAPSWSVDERNLWVLEILERFGFAYDSSLFPVKNFLYGFPEAPCRPFFPRLGDRTLKLLEIPVPIQKIGPIRLAYSGGIFFSLWPFWVIRRLADSTLERGGPCLFYFHPWDLWKRSPEQTSILKARWINLHLGDTLSKFLKVLDAYPLGSVTGLLEELRAQAETVSLGGAGHDH